MNIKLSECPNRSNNLQLLRFVAAVLVIIAHSYSISTGDSKGEILLYITNGQLGLGGLAVSIFFCAGGYLIARSIYRINSTMEYFKARIIRLFPSLFVVVFVCSFIMGPIVSSLSLTEYFKNVQVYKYMLNAVLVLQHSLPGVFSENIYIDTVNGSLWTLPVEFLCYVGCFFMWKVHLLEKKKILLSIPMVLVGIAAIYFVVHYLGISVLLEAIRPMLLFYVGMLFYVRRDDIIFSNKYLVSCILGIIISIPLHILNVVWIICFPYILLYFCFGLHQIPEKIGNIGNLSYGIYLCAFPIQQWIVYMSGGSMNPFVNMLLAIPAAIVCGELLYIFVEKPLMSRTKRGKSK